MEIDENWPIIYQWCHLESNPKTAKNRGKIIKKKYLNLILINLYYVGKIILTHSSIILVSKGLKHTYIEGAQIRIRPRQARFPADLWNQYAASATIFQKGRMEGPKIDRIDQTF